MITIEYFPYRAPVNVRPVAQRGGLVWLLIVLCGVGAGLVACATPEKPSSPFVGAVQGSLDGIAASSREIHSNLASAEKAFAPAEPVEVKQNVQAADEIALSIPKQAAETSAETVDLAKKCDTYYRAWQSDEKFEGAHPWLGRRSVAIERGLFWGGIAAVVLFIVGSAFLGGAPFFAGLTSGAMVFFGHLFTFGMAGLHKVFTWLFGEIGAGLNALSHNPNPPKTAVAAAATNTSTVAAGV